MQTDLIRLIRSVDPKEGRLMLRWTARDAALIDRAVKLHLASWHTDSTRYNARHPRTRHHGMRITLTLRGRILREKLAR